MGINQLTKITGILARNSTQSIKWMVLLILLIVMQPLAGNAQGYELDFVKQARCGWIDSTGRVIPLLEGIPEGYVSPNLELIVEFEKIDWVDGDYITVALEELVHWCAYPFDETCIADSSRWIPHDVVYSELAKLTPQVLRLAPIHYKIKYGYWHPVYTRRSFRFAIYLSRDRKIVSCQSWEIE